MSNLVAVRDSRLRNDLPLAVDVSPWHTRHALDQTMGRP